MTLPRRRSSRPCPRTRVARVVCESMSEAILVRCVSSSRLARSAATGPKAELGVVPPSTAKLVVDSGVVVDPGGVAVVHRVASRSSSTRQAIWYVMEGRGEGGGGRTYAGIHASARLFPCVILFCLYANSFFYICLPLCCTSLPPRLSPWVAFDVACFVFLSFFFFLDAPVA